jgi:hypothetical protein
LARSSKRPSSPAAAGDAPTSSSARTGTQPNHLHTITLVSKGTGLALIAGIAALDLSSLPHSAPDAALIETLSAALIDQDDVDPATCFM